ncbi:M23 family metallopeptidase [Metabacillus idriensis]|uniref:M23 family metallopeptidase n=1 Tax=Metabacillus idriensis TaxID=324768 RepID=UPI00174C037A|nr:M23 family metallopeptidase [Metabacillus idriensis]
MEVVGNTLKFKITSPYQATEPFRTHPHNGIDISFPTGTPLHSVNSGVVDKVVNYGDKDLGLGVFVKLKNGDTAIYGHMKDVSVQKGDQVNKGTMLGHSGNTGHSTGPHLHFAERNSSGDFIDPTHHYEQLTTMSGNSERSALVESVNEFSDWVISKEVEILFKPLGMLLKQSFIDLMLYIQLHLPEIMGSATLIAAILIVFGFRIPKVMMYYSFAFVVAAYWLSAT